MPQIEKITSDSYSTPKTNPRNDFSEKLERGSHNAKVPINDLSTAVDWSNLFDKIQPP